MGTQRVLVIMSSYADTRFERGYNASYVRNLLDGADGLDAYVQQNSLGLASIDVVDVIQAEHPDSRACAHRYDYCGIPQVMSARRIAIDSHGRLVLINRDGEVLRQRGHRFFSSGLMALDIDAGPAGGVVAIEDDGSRSGVGRVFYGRNGRLRDTGLIAKRAALDAAQGIWTITSGDELRDPDGTIYSGSSVGDLDVAADNTVYVRSAGRTGNVLRLEEDDTFTDFGESRTIRVVTPPDSNNIWSIRDDGGVKKYDGKKWLWWGPRVIDLDINSDGEAAYIEASTTLSGPVFRFTRTVDDQGDFEWAYHEILETIETSTFDFAAYDDDGDGRIKNDELSIIFFEAIPDKGPGEPFGNIGGINRTLPACASVSGGAVSICEEAKLALVAQKTGFHTITHEFTHSFGSQDLYGAGSRMSYELTLMGATVDTIAMPMVDHTIEDGHHYYHLDPWHKLKFGWIAPAEIAFDAGLAPITLDLFPAHDDTGYNPVILYDPSHGEHEYFMLEFRQQGEFDRDVNEEGVALWRVATDGDHLRFNFPTVSGNPDQVDSSVYHYGAPPSPVVGGNALWKQDHGLVTVRWADGIDSGLRFRVDAVYTGGDARATVTLMGKDVPIQWVGDRIETVALKDFDWHCPTVVHDGDREFDGNGPNLVAEAHLFPDALGQTLSTLVFLGATEIDGDGSATSGAWVEPVFQAPAGWRIAEIKAFDPNVPEDYSQTSGVSEDGPSLPSDAAPVHSWPARGGNLVGQFLIIGDTHADDISRDADCNDDTSIKLRFNSKTLRMVRP